MDQLICKNLKLGYENITLTEDLSFSVEKGDYLCIVGENGAGKSTLMRTLLRLQKPLSGTIEYGDDLKASKIGYLPQQTVVQKDFPASVFEVVLSGCQNSLGFHLFYSKADRKRAPQKREPWTTWRVWASATSRNGVTGICPAASSSAFYLREPSAPRRRCSFLMNRSRDWIRS